MHEDKQTDNSEMLARRKLLKMAAYVPPAILGVMIAGTKVAEAKKVPPGGTKICSGGPIVVSAGGTACCPCVPGDPKYNPVKCDKERCKLGNCAACRRLVFKKLKDCQKKQAICGGTCVESPPGSGFWHLI